MASYKNSNLMEGKYHIIMTSYKIWAKYNNYFKRNWIKTNIALITQLSILTNDKVVLNHE